MAELPRRGVAAHRGGPAHAPENTCAAFREAVRLGAHQIELDLRRSGDGALVVIHDETVARTTGERGKVARLTLAELRALDAGARFGAEVVGERIPTLAEALDAVPRDVWLNLQIKRGEPIAAEVARVLVREDRLEGAFLACGNSAAREARAVHPDLLVCNLARQRTRAGYVAHAAATGASFVQYHHLRGTPTPEDVALAHAAGLRVNHFCAPQADDLDACFAAGVDFVLVDDVVRGLAAAARHGIRPLVRPRATGTAGTGSASSR